MEAFKWMRHFRERVTFTLVSIAPFQRAILLNRRSRGGGSTSKRGIETSPRNRVDRKVN